MEMME